MATQTTQTRRKRTSSTKAKTTTRKTSEPVAQLVDIASIQVEAQPRRYFDPDKQEQLVESIKKHGILEPLIVRPVEKGKYKLVAGERRYRAAKEIGLKQVPISIRELNDQEALELALLENLQRDDLNPIDETEGILMLLSQSLNCANEDVVSLLNKAANAQRRGEALTDNVTRQIEKVDALFKTVGRLNRESFRTNRLPLLNLPEDVLEVLREGKLEYTKAKAISKVSEEHRQSLLDQSIQEGLSLSTIKKLIKELEKSPSNPRDLKEEFKAITRIKSTAWNDASKKKKLEKLMAEMRHLLESR